MSWLSQGVWEDLWRGGVPNILGKEVTKPAIKEHIFYHHIGALKKKMEPLKKMQQLKLENFHDKVMSRDMQVGSNYKESLGWDVWAAALALTGGGRGGDTGARRRVQWVCWLQNGVVIKNTTSMTRSSTSKMWCRPDPRYKRAEQDS